MERGELSYSKVRAITRVASAATEEYFLMIARHGTAHHTEQLVKYFRRATEQEELSREARQRMNRSVTYAYDLDGSLIVRARLPATDGAMFVKALESAEQQIRPEDVSAETPDDRSPFAQRRADALAMVARTYLNGGEGAPAEIVVHVDERTLRGDIAGECGLEHGPALAAETARRLGCDATAVVVVEDEKGRPLDVGRKTRIIPPKLRQALKSRDRGCRFPGCPNKRYVDGHHIRHWARGGTTDLANLVSLCSFHHRKVHEGSFQVKVLDDGAIRFTQPDGQSFNSASPIATEWRNLMRLNVQRGVRIDGRTASTRWTGERMDYSTAVRYLVRRQSRGDVSAETFS